MRDLFKGIRRSIKKELDDIASDFRQAAKPFRDFDSKLLSYDRILARHARKGSMLASSQYRKYGDICRKVQAMLDSDFTRHRGEVFIKVASGFSEEAYHLLSKGPVEGITRLSNLPYLVVRTGAKEGQLARYCRKEMGTRIIASRGCYLPELFMEYGKRLGIKSSARIPRRRKQDSLWNLTNIGAYAAQETTQGEGSIVAVIDTGIDYNHREVRGRFGTEKGYNFVRANADPMDDNGHGTHCAGIAAGDKTGVANACQLYALKVLDAEGAGTLGDIIQAIDWCISMKPDIVSMSLGSGEPSDIEEDAVFAAYQAGITLVAAAGNSYYGPSFPASYDGVIAVAAVDIDNNHADFSNIFPTNDISAPGVDIYSSVPGGYEYLSGTSMATPHVSGSLGLVTSISRSSPDNLEWLLKDTARNLGSQDEYGAGLVKADAMVDQMKTFKAKRRVR
jgi:subtilisin family serine protease